MEEIRDENLSNIAGGATYNMDSRGKISTNINVTQQEYNALVKGGFINSGDKEIDLTADAIDYLNKQGFKVKYDYHITWEHQDDNFIDVNIIDK